MLHLQYINGLCVLSYAKRLGIFCVRKAIESRTDCFDHFLVQTWNFHLHIYSSALEIKILTGFVLQPIYIGTSWVIFITIVKFPFSICSKCAKSLHGKTSNVVRIAFQCFFCETPPPPKVLQKPIWYAHGSLMGFTFKILSCLCFPDSTIMLFDWIGNLLFV